MFLKFFPHHSVRLNVLVVFLLGIFSMPAFVMANPSQNNATPENSTSKISTPTAAATPTTSVPDPSILIPRSMIFSDPERTEVQISRDGKYLSYMAPYDGVLNIWVGKVDDPQSMRAITHNKKRRVASYSWALTHKHIVYLDDNEGDEDWRIYRVDVTTGEKLSLAAFKKVQARILAKSEYHPEEILISLNQRRPEFHDVYRLNIITGKMDLVFENNKYIEFMTDDHLNLRVAFQTTEDGGAILYELIKKAASNNYDEKEMFRVSQQDLFTTSPLTFNKAGNQLYMLDSRGRNTAALVSYDMKNKNLKLIAENALADIESILVHPTEKNIEAYAVNYLQTEWTPLDNGTKADLAYLNQLASGEVSVASRTLDGNTWIVAFMRDIGAPHYYHYDRVTKKARFLFSSRPELDKMPLASMDPVIIKSRDNLSLISYLTLPKDIRSDKAKAKQPVPLVLYVHGGPHARDDWGYSPTHQWLANRGYAVLSVNYRTSTGFGKHFVNAGHGEWAGKMHDDLIDAVDWAVKNGITTQDKVAIMGGSYGGYATLVGLTKTPDTFACGVDIVGVSNLETFLTTIPPYWKPMAALLKIMIGGDPATPEGRHFLASRSPITFVQNIKKPLLIGQGANDPRVKQAESDQIVKTMQEKKIPVTYILYPDEGHGFARPENRLSFYAVTEAFLSKYLGGKLEPIQNDFKNSSIDIKVGKEHVL